MLTKAAGRTSANSVFRGVRRNVGGSLIEVLVSLLLVAFGFLGIGAMYNFSIAANKSASSRLVALMLAQDYADMVRANPRGLRANAYNRSFASFDPTAKSVASLNPSNLCAYPACTEISVATHDRELFTQRVRALLPAGNFIATRSTTGNTDAMDVWIVWVEGRNSTDPNTSNDICPGVVVNQTPAPDPYPRCVHVRFAL